MYVSDLGFTAKKLFTIIGISMPDINPTMPYFPVISKSCPHGTLKLPPTLLDRINDSQKVAVSSKTTQEKDATHFQQGKTWASPYTGPRHNIYARRISQRFHQVIRSEYPHTRNLSFILPASKGPYITTYAGPFIELDGSSG